MSAIFGPAAGDPRQRRKTAEGRTVKFRTGWPGAIRVQSHRAGRDFPVPRRQSGQGPVPADTAGDTAPTAMKFQQNHRFPGKSQP